MQPAYAAVDVQHQFPLLWYLPPQPVRARPHHWRSPVQHIHRRLTICDFRRYLMQVVRACTPIPVIDHTIVMGAEYFESEKELRDNKKKSIPNIGIGNDCEIRNAIIDNNARIGHGVKLINERNVAYEDTESHVIRDGIIIIPANSLIPDGTVI